MGKLQLRYRKHGVYAPIFRYCEPISQLIDALSNLERFYVLLG